MPVVDSAADTAATTEEGESEAHVVTGVPPVSTFFLLSEIKYRIVQNILNDSLASRGVHNGRGGAWEDARGVSVAELLGC